MIEEALDSPAFWILGGGGLAAEIIGYIYGGKMGMPSFPWWQFLILIIGTLFVAAFIATKD